MGICQPVAPCKALPQGMPGRPGPLWAHMLAGQPLPWLRLVSKASPAPRLVRQHLAALCVPCALAALPAAKPPAAPRPRRRLPLLRCAVLPEKPPWRQP